MSDQENPGQQQAPSDDENFMNSINMAFNMGVTANQTYKQSKSVVEVSAELGEQIFQNLKEAYGSEIDENFLWANTEYFLQIALMGFMVPTICAYEPEFKDKLLSLVLKKTKEDQKKRSASGGGDSSNGESGGSSGGGSRIIT